jgi:LPXTG-site transpeptidase (sortase) family protein
VRLTRAGVVILALVGLLCVLLVSYGLATFWRVVSDPGESRGVTQPTLSTPPTPGHVPARTKSPRLFVPEVDIAAPVVPIQLQEDGVLDPPTAVSAVGWWDGSADAGAGEGQTVMTGHTVRGGGGVMDDLEELEEGDLVHVTDRDGRVDYEVTDVVTWTKAELAANAVEAFGQDRHHGRLVLVTCEDWESGAYSSNVIVFADPVQDT